jgi:hypothetical protein
MNFKADLIEALTDTVTHQSKAINGLLVNADRMQKVIETLTQLKEQLEEQNELYVADIRLLEQQRDEAWNEGARLKRLSEEQSKVINEFRNGF